MEDENANWFKTVIDYLKYFNVTVLPRMEQEILAIKTKVGALTRGSTKGSKGRARRRRR